MTITFTLTSTIIMDLFGQKPDKHFHSPILIYSITINRQFKFSWIEKGEKTK